MEEKLIETFMQTGSVSETARRLHRLKSNVSVSLMRLRVAGVKLPPIQGQPRQMAKYTPQRVAELNQFIEQLGKDGQSA